MHHTAVKPNIQHYNRRTGHKDKYDHIMDNYSISRQTQKMQTLISMSPDH